MSRLLFIIYSALLCLRTAWIFPYPWLLHTVMTAAAAPWSSLTHCLKLWLRLLWAWLFWSDKQGLIATATYYTLIDAHNHLVWLKGAVVFFCPSLHISKHPVLSPLPPPLLPLPHTQPHYGGSFMFDHDPCPLCPLTRSHTLSGGLWWAT